MNFKLKIRPASITLAIIIAINLYYFYLIDTYEITVASLPLRDIAILIAAMWGIYYWIKLKNCRKIQYLFKWWMVGIVVLAFTSTIQSYVLYSQPFILGLAPQRYVLVWALMYFPICKCLKCDVIKKQDLIGIIKIIGLIQLFLFIINFYVENSFLYVNTGLRNGQTRYYFACILLDLLFFFCLDSVTVKKGAAKLPYLLIAAAILFEIIEVQQFRLSSMGLIICGGFYIVLVRIQKEYKMVYFVIGCIATGILFNTSLVQDVLTRVLTNNYDAGTKIRSVGRDLYFAAIINHPILGGGYPSSYYQPAQVASGASRLIYLYDNGVFGFMYMYGLAGIVWVVSLWGKLLSRGWKLYKNNKVLVYLLFALFFIVTCINELHWYWEYGFVVFSLFLALENEEIWENENASLEHAKAIMVG